MIDIGILIKAARQGKGMSQEELARAIGSTKSAISRYESGRREPSFDTFQAIAAALGVSVGALLGMDAPPADAPALAPELTAPMRRAMDAMNGLNREGQERVADYAEDLEASGRYIKTGQSGMGQKQA